MTDKPTPTTDLLKRCAEIYEWRSTGVLSGEALRDYAKRKWPDLHDTLQMAEHETVTEALALLAKWGTPQPVVREPLSDDTERLEWLLWKLPGDALRYVVGELADTSSGSEFRAAIDAAIKKGATT